MALDITTQDLVIDETLGNQDDDSNVVNPTVTYLLGLDGAGGITPPEVAYKTNFVVASASAGETISTVVLSQNANGTPFSTTVGVNSNIQTVDGNYVWLFRDAANANVVIGVIGTSDPLAEPVETGPLAFSFALVNTSNTNADLVTVQYVPLLHPDETNPDDRIDLSDMVFASVSATTTASFLGSNAAPGNNEFYLINSTNDPSNQLLVIGLNGGAANVSTQGFGVDNQSINPNETLQVDFVTGGNDPAGSASEIQYASHIETITAAGFTINQITPSNPNLRVDISISAFNNSGNEQGTDFFDGTTAAGVDITSIKLSGASGFASTITTDGTYATGSGNVVVSGLSGSGNTVTIRGLDNVSIVDLTTASPMDRLQVTGVDSNEGLDITEFHFSTTTPSAYTEQVGSFINFDDDGPTLAITAAPVVGAAEVVEASGALGQAQATITPPAYTASAVDGYTTNVTHALALAGATATGLQTTTGNHAITLVADSATQISGQYDSNGDATLDATAFTVTLSGTTVTLTSLVALEHSNAPQGVGEDNTLDLDGLVNVVSTVTATDGDEDVVSSESTSSGLSLTFNDTDPTLSITAATVVGAAEVVEASGALGEAQATITPPAYTASAVDGYTTNVTHALALAGATATGLQTTTGNHAITLVADSATQISGQYDSNGDATLDATAFTVTLSGTTVTLTSLVALEHSNAPQGVGEDNTLDLDGLINVVSTVTVTDGDEDVVSSESTNAGLSLTFNDTDPVITAPFDADPVTQGIQTPEQLGNAVGQTASGAFGYDMTDKRAAAEYLTGGSDFVDVDSSLAGVQISLTGTVDNAQNPSITNAVATLMSESLTSATFNFSFHYDKDPITAGVQDAMAAGNLVFDKDLDTYTFTLTDVIEGFSFEVLQTSELVAKRPTGNTGQPLIVAQQLTQDGDANPFFVQFTANAVTRQIGFGFNTIGEGDPVANDTTFNAGDLVTNRNEVWVSATQATNGVAGDTIQKGELLTLRFFKENILNDVNPAAPGGGTERLDPTASASGIVIKFDLIGNSEDLVVILDMKDASGNETTRAINVENSDLIKGTANIPFPYSTQFTLDNNDALLIIEQNDYTVAGETYQIQGMQIMQSGNGLTGLAINLNGAIGASGGSSATSNLTAFDPTDTDVVKIVDIGFVQQTSGTIDATLDFSFALADADGDTTLQQLLSVNVSNDFIFS
ncbi:beta strand repeat-containing protein [Falsiroseomonas sp. E2-1-a4]|uniref:beta strand repeat-containing protein n=1 Tax=Falsiroseomonas sp. E2-1-a4 TaxID=3239299 RepID=UPI003F3FEC3F